MTDDQYEFCKKEANRIAKIIMDKDVSKIFGKDGNANIILNTLVHICAGTFYLMSKQIPMSYKDILEAFSSQVILQIEENNPKNNIKRTVN